ncbi:MAG: DUF309 domain-containing protein [Actinomycetota bacterium]|nr:DUF309 domain-containing protein [Actinomycetota bacterium]
MKIDVQLHAVLRDLIPGGKAEVQMADGATVAVLLDQLGIDEELRELVTVNSVQVQDLETVLDEGDSVSVFPAVAGGSDAKSPERQLRSYHIDEGLRLINAGEFFLAHETLEEYWVDAPTPERDFLQGLIHLATGLLHRSRNNQRGAELQFTKAMKRLSAYPSVHERVDLDAIRRFLAEATSSPPGPEPPQL